MPMPDLVPSPQEEFSPEELHSQEGLTIRKNRKNKFCIVSLYYFADPTKRSKEWEEEARHGLSEAQWRKEYLIDYTAQAGSKVFQEIITHADKIILKPPYPEFDPKQPYFGGLDYGSNSPSSFHVYTMLDDVIYCVWELYQPCRSVADFTNKMKDCPYWSKIKYIAADPSIWFSNQQAQTGNITSIQNYFFENGVFNLIKGLTEEQAWIAEVRERWGDPDNIRFKIHDSCRNMIGEFESAVYASVSIQNAINKLVKDDIANYNNHALDDCKYFMNSRPENSLQQREIKWPIMVNRWKQ
jgi:hypothetical protein